MRRFLPAPRERALAGGLTRRLGFSAILAVVALLASQGCGGPAPGEAPSSNLGDNSGLRLPPGFKPVDLPLEKRQEIFREAHRVRALAVREANGKLPMDEAHLPVGDKPAFDKRVADHRAIIDGVLATNLAELAKKHNISKEDLDKIEDEANKLRWTPPQEPTAEEIAAVSKPSEDTPPAGEKGQEKEKKGDAGPKPSEDTKPAEKEAR